MTIPERIPAIQQIHDREVCRLANKYSSLPIWSSCPDVPNRVNLPSFPYDGKNYEPDVFLKQVPPQGENTPVDWIFEIETSESVTTDHTRNQLTAFEEYAKHNASRIIVLVPPQNIEEMRTNLRQWGLTHVAVQPWGWPT
jgi:hypothetical protein